MRNCSVGVPCLTVVAFAILIIQLHVTLSKSKIIDVELGEYFHSTRHDLFSRRQPSHVRKPGGLLRTYRRTYDEDKSTKQQEIEDKSKMKVKEEDNLSEPEMTKALESNTVHSPYLTKKARDAHFIRAPTFSWCKKLKGFPGCRPSPRKEK